jgi:type VI protein secretion system component Hcp
MKRSVGRDHEHETRRSQEAPERGPEPIAAELLALQRSAGNRAVAAMLARDTKTPPKPKEDKAAPPKPTGPHVTIEGIGVISLESFQWGSHQGAGGHGGGRPQVTEMQLSSKLGPHSNDLFRATLSGEPHDAEIVYLTKDGELRVKFQGAIVSSYSTSGAGKDAMESWTLNFTGVEFKRPKDGEAKQDDVSAWDLGERHPG